MRTIYKLEIQNQARAVTEALQISHLKHVENIMLHSKPQRQLIKHATDFMSQTKTTLKAIVDAFWDWMLKSLDLKKPPRLNTLQELETFIHEQSAFVSQVTLYTYVKARAGTQHPKLFENETYLASLKIARWHIYGACVCDLATYCVARISRNVDLQTANVRALASHLIGDILSHVDQADIEANALKDMSASGVKRAKSTDWDHEAEGANAFQSSADAVLRWAPLADEFKDLDEQIVRNSIHLRWIGVRREVLKRLDAEEILMQWQENTANK